MGFSIKACLFSTALLAASVQGHMKMKTPTAYGLENLNNSPLDSTGSDFPCKQRPGVYAMPPGGSTVMAHGEQQTLSFTGSAVHGGGSCQIALTKDLQPTKDSKWMVIKSIIGGCPANVPGNLPADPNGSGASTFQYTIPDGIEPGDYALSWTWFNKIGNREMYQNCAPVTVTGAKKRRYAPAEKFVAEKRQSSFPDLFVANIGNGVTTPENFEIIFANGGADVQTAGQGPFTQMPGGNGGSGPAPPQQTQSPAAAETATGTAPATVATTYGGGYGGNNGGNNGGNGQYSASAAGFAEGASSLSGVVTPVATDGTPLSTSAPAAPVATAATNDTGKSNDPATGSSGGCTEGNWKCIDGSSFQRCASGEWSAIMQLAAGMQCEIGESANIAMSKVSKRSHTHGHGHFHFFSS